MGWSAILKKEQNYFFANSFLVCWKSRWSKALKYEIVKAVEENVDLFYTLRDGETCRHADSIEAIKEIINFTTKKYTIVLPKEEEMP